jgi:hypothetical protein
MYFSRITSILPESRCRKKFILPKYILPESSWGQNNDFEEIHSARIQLEQRVILPKYIQPQTILPEFILPEYIRPKYILPESNLKQNQDSA